MKIRNATLVSGSYILVQILWRIANVGVETQPNGVWFTSKIPMIRSGPLQCMEYAICLLLNLVWKRNKCNQSRLSSINHPFGCLRTYQTHSQNIVKLITLFSAMNVQEHLYIARSMAYSILNIEYTWNMKTAEDKSQSLLREIGLADGWWPFAKEIGNWWTLPNAQELRKVADKDPEGNKIAWDQKGYYCD